MTPFEKAVSEIDSRTYDYNDENAIESTSDDGIMIDYQSGAKMLTCSFSRKKWVNLIMKYAEEYPNEVQICYKNKDGSIVAHIPITYLHIYRPKELSEKQREKLSKRMKEYNSNH